MAQAGFNAQAYYTAADRSQLAVLANNLSEAQKTVEENRKHSAAWTLFYNEMSGQCAGGIPPSTPFQYTNPVNGDVYNYTCQGIDTVRNNAVVWKQRLDQSLANYQIANAAYTDFKTSLDAKYYNQWQIDKKKAEGAVQSAIASKAWADWMQENAIWVILAVIIIIFIIVRFRRS